MVELSKLGANVKYLYVKESFSNIRWCNCMRSNVL